MRTNLQLRRGPERQSRAPSNGGLPDDVVLSVRGLAVEYKARRGGVKAVRDASFDLYKGESLALIGESGCGKTTLALALVRMLVKMARISDGEVIYQREGQLTDVLSLDDNQLRHFRWKECSVVFQAAQNSFNPVLRIAEQFLDTARAHGLNDTTEVDRRARDLLRKVQLDPDRVLRSYPHELSGGMRQRVLIALSLLLEPQVVILDEPTTALDILTQRNIIDVLNGLRKQLGFTLLFVSHDLAMAAELADRVATMYAGRIIETGNVYDIFRNPRHPYTFGLMQATPTLHDDARELVSIEGSPPDLIQMPSGCKFHPRCPFMKEPHCTAEDPPLLEVGPRHAAACWYWQEVEGAVEGYKAEKAAKGVRP
jgi:peptide/nickel transport system ATP-binding protein